MPASKREMSHGGVTFFTATYAADMDRFLLQRESLERCGIDIPHIAVVNTEDLASFKAIPFQRNLKLVTTADVLPRKLEMRRLARKYRLRHPMRWIGRRPLAGWWVQQLAKLNAPSLVETEAIVSLDSDTFFVRHVCEDDFFSEDGRLHFYETRDGMTVNTCNWLGRSMHFLGISTDHPARQYIHNPVPMHRQVILDLQQHIEKRHKKNWMKSMLQWDATEYSTYGAYAKYINDLNRLFLTRPPISLSYWSKNDVIGFASDFPVKLHDERVKIVCIQSHTGLNLSDFRPMVEMFWPGSRESASRHDASRLSFSA